MVRQQGILFVFMFLLAMMTHDYNTREKKYSYASNYDDALPNEKVKENIINHIEALQEMSFFI